jgi:uncharacterized damage-inducible protein DinB
MTRIEEIRQLYAYNRWATEQHLQSVSHLSDERFRQDMGSSFASIRDTLVHIMSAEWVWLCRLQGTSPPGMPEAWKSLGLDEIARGWEEIDRSLQELVGRLEETVLDQPISYRNTAGQDFVSTRGQILRHVVNHSSYHRGQIVTMLRQLGAAAPATDLIAYYRAQLQAPLTP